MRLRYRSDIPSVRELYARGNNLATNSYELGLAVGNPTLDEAGLSAKDVLETNDAINLTLRRTSGPLNFEVGLFYQNVDDYVFRAPDRDSNRDGQSTQFSDLHCSESALCWH